MNIGSAFNRAAQAQRAADLQEVPHAPAKIAVNSIPSREDINAQNRIAQSRISPYLSAVNNVIPATSTTNLQRGIVPTTNDLVGGEARLTAATPASANIASNLPTSGGQARAMQAAQNTFPVNALGRNEAHMRL